MTSLPVTSRYMGRMMTHWSYLHVERDSFRAQENMSDGCCDSSRSVVPNTAGENLNVSYRTSMEYDIRTTGNLQICASAVIQQAWHCREDMIISLKFTLHY